MDYKDIIQRSLDYIEDNLDTELSAAELARQANFSLYHYYRLFQFATGMSVMQYILHRRLLHGIYAIHSGSSGIDTALKFGFDTYAGFYKAFQREFGCTPSVYLRSHRVKRPYRIDLKKEEHMTVTLKKAAQLLKHWNLESETITNIFCDGTGNKKENAFYVGDTYVLKVTANPGKLKNHAQLSRAIENVGLRAAMPVPAADGREYIADGELYFCLTKRLPGKQMTAASLYEGDTAAKARFVGEIIGQLHLALRHVEQYVNDADLPGTLENWALPRAKEALGLSDAFCRDYLAAFHDLYGKLPRQIIHRDPNPANIIRMDEQWGFIDFELSERNVRIYDPCYAAAAVLSESFGRENSKWLDICRSVLTGYDSVAVLTPEERRAIPYVILANQLVCVAWFADQEQYADIFETNKAMTLWLIDHFDALSMDI